MLTDSQTVLAIGAIVAENGMMIAMDVQGYFITGTDTGVGKTYIACELIRQLSRLHKNVRVRKPVESGCVVDAIGILTAADALQLQAANGNREQVTEIAPYRFRAALAPHRAARQEGFFLSLASLTEACTLDGAGDLLVVEGAGGFYSPLAEDALNADLASALNLPVIIVVKDCVGAVNQALMTIQAVASRKLVIAAIIMNRTEATHEAGMDNVKDLGQYYHQDIFSCAYQQPLPQVFNVEMNHQ